MTTEHRTNYEETKADRYDHMHFRDPALDPKKDNDWIIDSVRDTDQSPFFSAAAVMSPTYGNNEMWQNHWRHVADRHGTNGQSFNYTTEFRSGEDREGPLRAMCFTADLAYTHTQPFIQAKLEFQHSSGESAPVNFEGPYGPTARKAYEYAASPVVHPESKLGQFQNMHPDDWQETFPRLHSYCSDILQTGQNVTFQGIVDQDEQMLAAGRAMMNAAHDFLDSSTSNKLSSKFILALSKPELFSVAPQGDLDEQNNFANARQQQANFHASIMGAIADDYPQALQAARFSAAETYISRDADSYHTRTMIAISGSNAFYGLKEILSDVNNDAFQNHYSTIRDEAQTTLHQASDPAANDEQKVQFQLAYRELHLASEHITNFSQGMLDNSCHDTVDALKAGRDAATQFATLAESGAQHSDLVDHIRQLQESIPVWFDDGTSFTRIAELIHQRAHQRFEFAITTLNNNEGEDWTTGDVDDANMNDILDNIRAAQTATTASRLLSFANILAAGNPNS